MANEEKYISQGATNFQGPLKFTAIDSASVETPASDYVTLFADPSNENKLSLLDSTGTVTELGTGAGSSIDYISLSAGAVNFGMDNLVGGYPANITDLSEEDLTITLESLDDDALDPAKYIIGELVYIAHNLLNNDPISLEIANVETVYDEDDEETVASIVLTVIVPDDFTTPTVNTDLPGIAIVYDADCATTTQANGQGNVVSGESAGASGSYNLVVGLDSQAFGVGNNLDGDILLVTGNGNWVYGSSMTVDGVGNKVFGQLNYVKGSSNDIDGQGLFVYGDMITIDDGINGMAFGRNITMSECNLSVAIGTQLTITAKSSFTAGYKLTNDADHSMLVGRYGELEDSPENEGAFVVAGGDTDDMQEAFSVRSRKKVENVLYDADNDEDGDGIDDDGNEQYEAEVAYTSQFKGRLIGTSEETTGASGVVYLDHDLFSIWKITPTATTIPTLQNWNEDDTGTLIIYNGGSLISFLSEWEWVGNMPDLETDGVNIFSLRYVNDTLYIKDEVNLSSGVTSYADLTNKPTFSGFECRVSGLETQYFSTLDALATYLNTLDVDTYPGVVINVQPKATFTTTTALSFPAMIIEIYGNHSVLTFSGGATFAGDVNLMHVRLNGDITFDDTLEAEFCDFGGALTIETTSRIRHSNLYGAVTATDELILSQVTCTGIITSSDYLVIANNSYINVASTSAAVTSTTGGVLALNGCVIINTSTGGCVSCANGATAANPNMIANTYMYNGTVTAGDAVTFLSAYYATTDVSGTAFEYITSDTITTGVENTTTSGTYTPGTYDVTTLTMTGDLALSTPTLSTAGKSKSVEVTCSSDYTLTVTKNAKSYTDGIFLVTYYLLNGNTRVSVSEVE